MPLCVPGGNRRAADALERRHVERRSQRRLRKTDRHVDERVEPVAPEERVRRDAEIDVEIAGGTAANAGFAVAADANPRTVVDAGRERSR